MLIPIDPATRRFLPDPPPDGAVYTIVAVDEQALAAAGAAPGIRYLNADGAVRVEPDPALVAAAADRTRRQQLVATLQTDLATVQGSGSLTLALVKPILAHLIQAVLAIATLLPQQGID